MIIDYVDFYCPSHLKYYKELLLKIPRDDIESIEDMLRNTLYSIDQDAKFCICGSYRRLSMESGDIDFNDFIEVISIYIYIYIDIYIYIY